MRGSQKTVHKKAASHCTQRGSFTYEWYISVISVTCKQIGMYLNAPENVILLSYTLLQLLATVCLCIQVLLSGQVEVAYSSASGKGRIRREREVGRREENRSVCLGVKWYVWWFEQDRYSMHTYMSCIAKAEWWPYSGTSDNGLPLLRKTPQCGQVAAVPNYSL